MVNIRPESDLWNTHHRQYSSISFLIQLISTLPARPAAKGYFKLTRLAIVEVLTEIWYANNQPTEFLQFVFLFLCFHSGKWFFISWFFTTIFLVSLYIRNNLKRYDYALIKTIKRLISREHDKIYVRLSQIFFNFYATANSIQSIYFGGNFRNWCD